jgi:hypothetical protein
MVPVEVGIYDRIYVIGRDVKFSEGFREGMASIDGKHGAELLIPFISYARIHKDFFIPRDNQKRAQAEENPVFLIRGIGLLPENPGDNPEHRPAVKAEKPVTY